MRKSKFIFFVVNLILTIPIVSPLLCQTSIHSKRIYEAYINNDMKKWATTLQRMENENLYATDKKLELISYYYGYIVHLIEGNDKKQAKTYIEKGENLIDDILKSSPDNAAATAFKGSFTGFKVLLNKVKTVTLGPKSMKYINKSYELNPNNIQAITDKANMLYHAPGKYGDKKEAFLLFNKAIKKMENNGETIDNWYYLYTLTNLAQFYDNEKQLYNAVNTCEKILEVEPNYKRVKQDLYPTLQSKMNQTADINRF